jgi:hypothetical protein
MRHLSHLRGKLSILCRCSKKGDAGRVVCRPVVRKFEFSRKSLESVFLAAINELFQQKPSSITKASYFSKQKLMATMNVVCSDPCKQGMIWFLRWPESFVQVLLQQFSAGFR